MTYLLTVSRTDFSKRRQRWSDPAHQPSVRSVDGSGSPAAYPGLLVLVDDDGSIRRSVPLDSPKGMMRSNGGFLVACRSEVRCFDADLCASSTLVSEGWCNDLHSLRPSTRGFVVTASGIDAASELSLSGETLWTWWAAEHGFTTDSRGERRAFAKDEDHRRLIYPVEMQATHINSMASRDSQTFLATLFHQGALVTVDRESGKVHTLLDGLGRPHAVRVLEDGLITFADTTAGAAVLAHLHGGRLDVLQRIEVGTSWLQDAHFHGDGWLFVDGARSRVIHADAQGKVLQIDAFDSDWCLYEVMP